MVGRKMPTESKRCKKTTATFLKAFEDLFFSEKIIPLFSHFFRPSCRCPQNDLRMLMTFAGFQGRTPTTSVLEKKSDKPPSNATSKLHKVSIHLSPSSSREPTNPPAAKSSLPASPLGGEPHPLPDLL